MQFARIFWLGRDEIAQLPIIISLYFQIPSSRLPRNEFFFWHLFSYLIQSYEYNWQRNQQSHITSPWSMLHAAIIFLK